MKKVILLLLVAGLSSRLKAQQLQTPPAAGILKPDTTIFKKFTTPGLPGISMQSLTKPGQVNGGMQFYSYMPVLKLKGNPEQMPVYVPGKAGENYPMLIKRIDFIKPDTVNKSRITP